MNTVNLAEPRDLTRAAYHAAILTAPSQQAGDRLRMALQWYELKWQVQDAQVNKAQEAAQAERAEEKT